MRLPEKRYRPWCPIALLLALAVAAPVSARADARERFRRGQNAYDQSNFQLAIEQWEKAYKLEKKPRIQYNLALAYEHLGRLDKAIAALKRFLASADPDDPAFADASASLAAIEQRLASTGVRITGGVEGARVFIDGREWGLLPRPDRIPVQPGSHDVVIRHQGYRDFVSNVVVPAGQVVEVPVQMKKGEGGTAGAIFFRESNEKGERAPQSGGRDPGEQPEFFEDTASEEASSTGGDPTFWYIASGSLAAGAIGAAVWTAERAGQLGDCGSSDAYYCKNEETVRREQNLAALTTIVLGGGAIAALVYGLTLDSDRGDQDEEPEAEQQEQTLSCGPMLMGARCAMRF